MCETCGTPAFGRFSRRSLLKASCNLALAGGLAMAGGLAPALAQNPPQNAIAPEAALKRIMDGNARYAANSPNERDFSVRRAALAQSQHPIASIVSCADSRVAPEFAFDQAPGDLFVVRVAGNFVNEDGLASLEFGSEVLGAPVILVLGHSSCGAIRSTIDAVQNNTTLPGHLPALINAIRPAVEAAKKDNPTDMMAAATIANVRLNVEKLKTATPILSARVADKRLQVVGGIYELATGKVTLV